MSIGRQLRPNLKPVLRTMKSPEGAVLAYAKLGWNPLTRALVQNEAAALRAWSQASPRSLSVPQLLFEGVWNEMAITGDVALPASVLGSVRQRPSSDVILEVATLGGLELSERSPRARTGCSLLTG